MSYGQEMILTGMALGSLSTLVLITPSWWWRRMEILDLKHRLKSYRKNWKP